MPDESSTSEYEPEPPRPKTIPDDFIWDPPTQAWYAPGEPSDYDAAASRRELQEIIRQVREERIAEGTWGNGTVIRVGTHSNVPPTSRKSPRAAVKREPLPLFPDDDDTSPTNAAPASGDLDEDAPSEELF